MARPRSGSTGLVKAVPVLWVGMSSRQTGASADLRGRRRPGFARVASGCNRHGAGRFRRCAGQLNSQVEGDRADHVDRVSAGPAGQIAGVEVETGPEEFGPQIVGDHPRIGSLQGPDAARSFQCSCGVEPARDPVPVLDVAEEGAGDANVGAFRLRRQRLSELFAAAVPPVLRLDVVADTHAVDCGDPGRAGLAGPVGRPGDVGVFGREPSADLGQNDAVGVAGARLDRRGGVPAFDRVRPARRGAVDRDGPVPVSRCRWRTGVTECGQGPVNAVQVATVEMPLNRRIRAQAVQRRRGQIAQQRAAVEQQ